LKKLKIPILVAFIPIAILSIDFFINKVIQGSYFSDFVYYYYPEGTVFFEGLDPTKSGGTAFPWSYVLDIFYVLPFMPLNFSVVWGNVVYLCFTVILAFISTRKLGNKTIGIAITISSFPLLEGFSYGNYGALCCIFAIIALCFAEKNKWISGLFLALAMMKPHATGLIAIGMLVGGYITIDFIAAGIVIVASVISSLVMGDYPWNVMLRLLSFGSGNTGANAPRLGDLSSGLTSFLIAFGAEKWVVYLSSAIIGVIYCGVIICIFRKKGIKDLWTLSIPCAFALSFWFFENPHDELILLIPLIWFIKDMRDKYDGFRCNIVEAIEIMVLLFGAIGLYLAFKKALILLGLPITENVKFFMLTICHLIVAVIGVDICRRCCISKSYNLDLCD
jgi:hypothetical protein